MRPESAFSGTRSRIWARFTSSASAETPACSATKLSSSDSEIWMRLSTSRSRSRLRMMSCRMSSRNWLNDNPSASMRWRSAGTVSPLDSAMRPMAAFTVPSSTRTPVSRASCIWARSTIMRSSTWRSSTSRGGGWIFCRRSCISEMANRDRSSLAVITSSLTTATMRSSGRDVRGPLGGSGAGAGANRGTAGGLGRLHARALRQGESARRDERSKDRVRDDARENSGHSGGHS